MGWKLFAGLDGIMMLLAFWDLAARGGRTTVGGLIGLAVGVLTLAGLVGYAFEKRSLSPGFWRGFALVLSTWSIWSGGRALGGLTGLSAAEPAVAVGKLLGVGLALAFTLFSWLGVWRYSEWLSGRTGPAAVS